MNTTIVEEHAEALLETTCVTAENVEPGDIVVSAIRCSDDGPPYFYTFHVVSVGDWLPIGECGDRPVLVNIIRNDGVQVESQKLMYFSAIDKQQ